MNLNEDIDLKKRMKNITIQENSKNTKQFYHHSPTEKSLIMISVNIEKAESEKQGQISVAQEKLTNDAFESEGTQLKISQYRDAAQISRQSEI